MIPSLEFVHGSGSCFTILCSFYMQILGTGMDTQDTSPSILLFFDKQRLIFNAGEVFSAMTWFRYIYFRTS
jgi:hypothetical protein